MAPDGRLLLGVDIGTSSAKGVVTDAVGTIVAEATRPHQVRTPEPGHYEHDAEEDWWGGFLAIVADLGRQVELSRVAALSVSGIGPCVLPVDDEGRPLRPAILYGIDTRGVAIAERLNRSAPVDGRKLDSQAVWPKILWLEENEPEVWAHTHRILGCGGFLTLRLTGRAVVDRYEAGSYQPLLELDGSRWRGRDGTVPRDLLPELVGSADVVGAITTWAAEQTGLPEGCLVIAPTVDAAAEATGAGAGEPGDLMIMYGSTGFFILISAEHRDSTTFWTAPFLDAGTFSVAGGTNTLGTLLQWFRDEFGGTEVADERRGGRTAFESLMALGEQSAPGANGLLALPYFEGERTPLSDPTARGAVLGISLSSTRADVYRALVEAIAFTIKDNLDAMTAEGHEPRRLLAVGGGAKNLLLLQVVSDVTGLAQSVPDNTIGAARGDALRAAVGLGDFSTVAAAAATVRPARTIRPAADLAAFYRERFDVFKDAYASTRSVLARLRASASA
ncbi:FGGY-family carbohydrate kinase [Microbacterium xanthum]|uniref:FGGY-family carbohydrate kinase n=1 Tax=Microbacterium xanthum TaxID=3079794 RepID=UPI002AD482D7|nr:FGGY-family carbohydrate kinase [Microbacterium sp. KSW-48]MDZ8170763.1 FGGY-family carbohydrate kinase [Microbacterium sp. KSW-48]